MALHITHTECEKATYAQLIDLLEGFDSMSEVWEGVAGDWIIGAVGGLNEDDADDWMEYVLIGSVEKVLQELNAELQELNA